MRTRTWSLFPVILTALIGSRPASAQERSQAAASSGTTAAANSKPQTSESEDTAHFRSGFGIDGNYLTTSGLSGGALGLQLRLGAQINQWSAVYYQAHGLVGGVVGGTSGGGLLGGVFNSLMGELTLPVVHIGAGPSVDVLGIAGCSAGSGCDSDTGAHFGLDGRVALVIGGHGPGHHSGFAFNFNVHPTFVDGGVLTTLSVGLGGEFY